MHLIIELDPVKIVTKRLVQRDIQQQDIEDICKFLNLKEVQQYTLTDNPAFIRQHLIDAIENINDSPRHFYGLSVLLKDTENIIGQLDISIYPDSFGTEIGWELNSLYWDGNQFEPPQEQAIEFAKELVAQIGWDFDPFYWNKGYATEAVQGAITLAFSCLGVSAILAHCFFDNKASRRVIEKVGMQQQRLTLWQQGQLQECYQEARPILSYGLRKSSWQDEE
ncbi:MAG: GNAT family N-acetyltransferase [Cyanobacteria bacterium J06638_38]